MYGKPSNTTKWTTAALVGALLCPVALAREKASQPNPPKAPDGWVFMNEDLWDVIPDTTERHLQAAQQAFMKENYKDAASNIEKAAAVILFEGRRETNVKTKEALMDAVLDLERLAKNIEQHAAYSPTSLNQTFARAEWALAKHDVLGMRRAWEGVTRDMLAIGRRLDDAATHVDGAYLWAGTAAKRDDVDTVARAMSVAVALEDGDYRDGKQIQSAMTGLERDVKQLDKVVGKFPRVEDETKKLVTAPLPSPDGFVLVEDDVWFANSDEPGQLLHEARADYTNGNYDGASADLRETAVYLRIEGCRADQVETRDALFASANELKSLAQDIDNGTSVPSNRFARIFARVHYNLARADQQMASEAWAKKDTQRARKALAAAMMNLKQGFVWSGHDMEASAVDFSKKVESLCDRLAKKANVEDKEVKDAVGFVGAEVVRLGEQLKSA